MYILRNMANTSIRLPSLALAVRYHLLSRGFAKVEGILTNVCITVFRCQFSFSWRNDWFFFFKWIYYSSDKIYRKNLTKPNNEKIGISTCKDNAFSDLPNPLGICCQNDVVSTSMRRHHVTSTLIRRHFTSCARWESLREVWSGVPVRTNNLGPSMKLYRFWSRGQILIYDVRGFNPLRVSIRNDK